MLKNKNRVGMLVRWYGRVKNIFQISVYVIYIIYRGGAGEILMKTRKTYPETCLFNLDIFSIKNKERCSLPTNRLIAPAYAVAHRNGSPSFTIRKVGNKPAV